MRKLDGWVTYCNGSAATTPTHEVADGRGGRFSSKYTVAEAQAGGAQSGQVVPVGTDAVELEYEMDPWTRKVAEQDGYPFAPGKGSENFISDAELEDGGYGEVVVDETRREKRTARRFFSF